MRIVNVRFPGSRRIYTFEAGELEIAPNEILVVEGERGMRLGSAVAEPAEIEWRENKNPPKALRKADDEDLKKAQQNKARESEAALICQKAVMEHSLPIKLVKAEYIFDGSKIVFYFSAEGRVDFRELVRVLAHRLRTRIEMYQIGVRDEAKILGGLGICGRTFCCTSWLTDFSPVSIRMAKDQGLSLNPAKVSGGCGRLLCCLSYEHEAYAEFRVGSPKIGKRTATPKGTGRVSRYDIVKQLIFVIMEDGREVGFKREELKPAAAIEEPETPEPEETDESIQ